MGVSRYDRYSPVLHSKVPGHTLNRPVSLQSKGNAGQNIEVLNKVINIERVPNQINFEKLENRCTHVSMFLLHIYMEYVSGGSLE